MDGRLLPIFFMHVPKCAGISVFSVLSQAFAPGEICPQPADGTWRFQARDVPGYRLYSGHFSIDFINEMGTAGSRLIMLRHPLQRVVSLYDYWRSYRWEYIRRAFAPYPDNGPAIAKSGDLSRFLDSRYGRDEIYNPTALQLLGRRFGALMHDEDAAIAAAVKVLRGFDWIGTTDSFDASLTRLCRLLELPQPAAWPRENSTYEIAPDNPAFERVERSVPNEAERQRIVEGNRIDVAIFEAARALLNSGSPT